MHDNLDKLVLKHVGTHYQKPFRTHNLEAFEQIIAALDKQSFQSLILDSCCGTGLSTMTLAHQNPDSLVIGIDQSSHRLSKGSEVISQPDNCLLLQANCEDIWRLCAEKGIHFKQHFILYPNPWPKSVHLKRRWHGHPVFPVLKRIADTTIVRSNWLVYLEEFQRAWFLLTALSPTLQDFKVASPLTLFEKKYAESGQDLYELVCSS